MGAATDLGAVLLATQQEDVTEHSVTAYFELRGFNPAGGPAELRDSASLDAWVHGQVSPNWSDQGFGLWLARKLVEKMGGDVALKDGSGTFAFRVAFERVASSPDVHADGVGPGPGIGLGDFIMKPSVLIVDALSPLRAMLRRYVEAWGFSARDVDSLQARWQARTEAPAASTTSGAPPSPSGPYRQEAREELNLRYYTVVLINLQTKTMSGIHSPAQTSSAMSGIHSHVAQADGYNQALSEFNQAGPALAPCAPRPCAPAWRPAPHTRTACYLQVLDMKRDVGLMGVSVVVMSPFKQQQSLLKLKDPANEQGMWQVLTKPVSSHRLFKCLTEALSDDPKVSRPPCAAPRHFARPLATVAPRRPRCGQVSPSPVMRHGASSLDRFCQHPPSQDTLRRVLIADDHPVNQKLVRWILEAAGMECDVANNGLDAVRPQPRSLACRCLLALPPLVATSSPRARRCGSSRASPPSTTWCSWTSTCPGCPGWRRSWSKPRPGTLS